MALARRIAVLGPRVLLGLVIVAGLALGVIAADIVRFGTSDPGGRADAALVLGAAVLWDRPSPVYRERLRHAVDLYTEGRVGRLVLTGGRSPEDKLTEAEAGRRWMVASGVPEEAILLEDRSRTTGENFTNAMPILKENGIGSVLVVSDPIHMRRAMLIAERIGLDASPSPTPTSRFATLSTQMPFLARETWFMVTYLFEPTREPDR